MTNLTFRLITPFLLFFANPLVFAAEGFSFDDLAAVSKLAYEDFAKKNADHVEHLVGYKSWKSGDEARVKIYVKHDGMNMEFNYNCHRHDNSLECHAQ